MDPGLSGALSRVRRGLLPSCLVMALACAREPAARAPSARASAPPAALAGAFAFMDSALTPADRDPLRRWLPDSARSLHFTVGLWLRNEAGLWKGGPIADSLRAHGVRHPDDMSDVILRGYGLYLRGEPIDLDSLIRTVPPPPPAEGYHVLQRSGGKSGTGSRATP